MFRRNKKRQSKVEITFKHGDTTSDTPLKEVIEIPLGQHFQTDIGTDTLWEGDTLIKEWDWRAGFTRVYEYFYV